MHVKGLFWKSSLGQEYEWQWMKNKENWILFPR